MGRKLFFGQRIWVTCCFSHLLYQSWLSNSKICWYFPTNLNGCTVFLSLPFCHVNCAFFNYKVIIVPSNTDNVRLCDLFKLHFSPIEESIDWLNWNLYLHTWYSNHVFIFRRVFISVWLGGLRLLAYIPFRLQVTGFYNFCKSNSACISLAGDHTGVFMLN